MKPNNNILIKIITLLSVVFFLSCQKNDNNILPDDTDQKLGSSIDLLAPITDMDLYIPLAGNAFITNKITTSTESITSNGLENWSDASTVVSTFFRVNTTGVLDIKVKAKVANGTSMINVIIAGIAYPIELSENTFKSYKVATINITKVGYLKVDLQGVSKTGNTFATISDFAISGIVARTGVVFANDAENYTASRKGPTLQLQYTTPSDANIEWFYSQLSIPTFGERNGTKFSSNTFSDGSVGLEITASGEKRVYFSVENPATDLVTLSRKGTNAIHSTSATGVNSYISFNWSNLTNYEFLTQGKPDGNGNTVYTSWFYTPETNEWNLIASYINANTNSYLKNISSSLESTTTDNSFLARNGRYFNQWIKDANGTWTELTSAKFTGDIIAENKQRQDYAATVDLSSFFLRGNGFFSDYTALQTILNKPVTSIQPIIDFNNLP